MRKLLFINTLITTFSILFSAPEAHAEKWYVYHDFGASDAYIGHGLWTNIMPEQCGKQGVTTIEMNSTAPTPASGNSAVKLSFNIPNDPGWCGLVVTSKANFWGKKPEKDKVGKIGKYIPFFDLQRYNKLVYSVRGENGGEVIEVKFAITGEEGEEGFSDSAPLPIDCGIVKLSKNWEQKVCDIKIDAADRRLFLGRVITPFAVTVARSYNENRNNVSFYLDEIYFE